MPTNFACLVFCSIKSANYVSNNEYYTKLSRQYLPLFISRYDIFNFQQLSSGKFGYVRVGEWADGKLTINESSIAWSNGTKDGVTSFCSEPCPKAHVKVTHTLYFYDIH